MTFRTAAAPAYAYPAILEASERIQWRVEDLIGGPHQLDFARPFLPEALARVEPLAFLAPTERRTLNQIRARGYLHVLSLVEELIVPFVLAHVAPDVGGDSHRVRAFLQFAAEAAKHLHVFRRFAEAFAAGFASPCALVGPSIGQTVLAHEPLAVALFILQLEWTTQRHHLDGVQDARGLDPVFLSLLEHHWLEEAQHVKLDTRMVETLAAGRSPRALDRSVDEYLALAALLDARLDEQVRLDLASLERATGRPLRTGEREEFVAVQRRAQRWTFLGAGMTHERVLETLGELDPALRARVEAVAPTFR